MPTPVSVVICARNEAKNLLKNLKVILIQQHPQFEVIVVNDQSTDNTLDVLVDFYMRNKNLKIINVANEEKKDLAGKKYALLKGIDAAVYEHVVVTDADCRPSSTLWLAKLASCFGPNTNFVLGHAPFYKQSGFLNKLARYENYMTALQSFGWALNGVPYMGIGRNMAFRKSVIKGFDGFQKHPTLPTGDDDLLVNAKAGFNSTEVCIDKDAYMYSDTKPTFSEWLNQKRRHLRSGFHYKWWHQILLFIFSFSSAAFYFSVGATAYFGTVPFWIWALVATWILLRFAITYRMFTKLAVADLRLLWPVWDVCYLLYLVLIFFLLLLKPKNTWN